MAIHKLSKTRIERESKNGAYGDGNNLWLLVRNNGDSKVWIFRWKDRLTKKDRVISIGPQRFIGTDEARATAVRYCRMLWEGKDPKQERDARVLGEQIARGEARTMRQAIDEYDNAILTQFAVNTQISARRMLRIINRNIGDMPIAVVNKQVIIDQVLMKDDLWLKKNPTGAAVQYYLSQVFAFAIDKGYVPTGYNPALREQLNSALPKSSRVHKSKHHPGVPHKEMFKFMQDLRAYRYEGFLSAYQGRPPVALCLELIALTGCRPGEARQAQWKEFDFNEMIWTVPIEHLKMGHTYATDEPKRVPITKPMLALLEEAKIVAYPKERPAHDPRRRHSPNIFPRARHVPDCSPDALVFPNSVNEPYADGLLAKFIREQLSQWRPAVPHGFRTSLKNWWKANAFPMEWWEIQVDHRGDKMEKAYGRDDMLEQRRGKMELWGEHCSKPAPEPKAGKVLKLADKKKRSA
jgi:integrase